MDIGGIPVRVSDTAGLRYLLDTDNGSNAVEQIGIERAKKAVDEADIRLCVVSLENISSAGIDGEVAALLSPETAVFLNKLDKAKPEDLDRGRQIFSDHRTWIGSITDDNGMGPFVDGMAALLKQRYVSGLLS
jgi:tRNA modification GTPase